MIHRLLILTLPYTTPLHCTPLYHLVSFLSLFSYLLFSTNLFSDIMLSSSYITMICRSCWVKECLWLGTIGQTEVTNLILSYLCLPTYLPAGLPVCLPACLPACLIAYLSVCLSACLPACLLLFVCVFVRFNAFVCAFCSLPFLPTSPNLFLSSHFFSLFICICLYLSYNLPSYNAVFWLLPSVSITISLYFLHSLSLLSPRLVGDFARDGIRR